MYMQKSVSSNKYQYLFYEVLWDFNPPLITDHQHAPTMFSNAESLSARAYGFQYSEAILDLEDKVKERFWEISNEICTRQQLLILKLLAEGLTQIEISKKLGINQSSISKCILGNTSYSQYGKKCNPKFYGGVTKKLRKVIKNDKEMQELFAKIRELQEPIL